MDIFDGASENVVGGTTPAARNVICGNAQRRLRQQRDGNRIQGNYIGTDKSGTKDLGNGDARRPSSSTTPPATPSGARRPRRATSSPATRCNGVGIFGNSQNNEVLGNRIGTTANGTGALGNGEAGVLFRA